MSKKPKLTPWFSGLVAPARPGIYDRRCTVTGIDPVEGPEDGEYGGFAYWNGADWAGSWGTVEQALANSNELSGFRLSNESVWRGLAEAPAA